MLNIILFEPEIPPNTGNIIRLAANTGCQLHIIRPMGFDFDDKRLRRAGLDYHEWAQVKFYDSIEECVQNNTFRHVYALTTKAKHHYSDTAFNAEDAILFGPESRGLPNELLNAMADEEKLRIPMLPQSRSMNLSNSVSVVVFEAWRQQGFKGGN